MQSVTVQLPDHVYRRLTAAAQASQKLMFRRDYAAALLKWRGHVVPIPLSSQ